MAEVIALAGSIFAIVQIAGAATKLSRSLYATARKAGSAKEDIQNFAKDMNAFASIIHLAHDSIRRHCQNSNSAVLRYIWEHNIMGPLVEQTTRVGEHIEAVRPQIQGLRGRLKMVNQFRWIVFKRPEVKALHPETECVKTSLLLVMQVIALELAQHRQQEHQSHENRREIKNLKRQIEVHIETISILQEQRRASTPQHYHVSSSNLPVEHASLIQLAESMVDTGKVPEPDIESLSSDNSSVTSSWVTTNPSVPSHSDRSQPSDDLRIPPLFSGNTNSPSSPRSIEIQNGTTNRFRSLRLEYLDQEPPVEPAVAVNSIGVEENDYIAVRPTDTILRLNTDRHGQLETGNIMTSGGKTIPVTVFVDGELEGNVVSEKFAIENGLKIEDVEDDAGVAVGLGPMVGVGSTGQVELEWSKNILHRKPLKVHCWVVPYSGGHPVYFGKPFVDRREHYWGRGQQNL